MKNRISYKRYVVFTVFVFMILGTKIYAAEMSLTPAVSLRGAYDDNVLFNTTEEVEDYTSIISPSIEMDYNTERGAVDGRALLDIINYKEEEQLNTTNQRYELGGSYNLSERLAVQAEGVYIFDTTLESDLEETGRFTFREDRKRYDIMPGIFYAITERSNLNMDYTYRNVDYEFDESVDYTINRIRLRYNYKLNNGLDTLSVRPAYTLNESDTSKRHAYRFDIGWTRDVTEIYRLSAFIGYRRTEQDYKDERDNQTNNGGVVDIRFQRKGERSDMRFGYSRDLALTASGGLIEVDRFRLRVFYRIWERFGAGFEGRLYFTRDVDEDVNEDSQYFKVEPWIQYNLTENHTLGLHYDYSEEYDDALDSNRTASRSRVWLTLNFRFPQKW